MTTRRFLTLALLGMTLMFATVLTGCSSSPTTPVVPPTSTPVPATTPAGTVATTTPPATSQVAPTDTQGHTVIAVTDYAFTPAITTIKVGAQVVWLNNGKAKHSIVFDDGSVKSPDIAPGSVAGHKFTKAGTFKYHCGHHPQMTGSIIVK